MTRLFFISSKQSKPGFLYVAKSESGLRKIGISCNPDERVENLRRECLDHSIEIETRYFVSNMLFIEKTAHKLLAQKRVYGEWFDLSDMDLCELDRFIAGENKCLG